MLTEEQKNKLRQAGYNDTKIASYERARGTTQSSGFLDRAKNVITSQADEINKNFNSSDGTLSGNISAGVKTTTSAFNAIPKLGYEALPSVARKGLDFVGEKVSEGFGAVTDKISNTSLFKELGELEQKGFLTPDIAPEYFRTKNALTASGGAGEIAGDILLAGQGTKVLQKTVDVTKNAGKNLSIGIKDNVGKVTEKIKATATDAPEKIMQRVARISKGKQVKFEQMAGESVGKYLTKRGIYGNVDDITTKLYDRFTKSKTTADNALETLKGTFEPAPVKTALKELLERELRVSTTGAPSPILARVEQLAAKANKGWTMSEINEIKRMFEKSVKVDYLKQNLPEGVARATNIDSAIRNWQLTQAKTLGLKNLDKINYETRIAKQLLNDLGAEYAGSAANNGITLTDWIMLSGGDPTAISGFLVKKGFSSKSVQSAIAKALNKGKETLGDVRADLGTSQVKQLPAGNLSAPKVQVYQPIITKGASTLEKAAQSIRTQFYGKPVQLTLPSGDKIYKNPNVINVKPINLPESITKTNLGSDVINNAEQYLTKMNPKTGDIFVKNLKTGKVSYFPKLKN